MHRYAALFVAAGTVACTHQHVAKVESAELAPPSAPMVQHSARLWVELEGTPDKQCEQTPTELRLCFAGVSEALGSALTRTLWPSFPGVVVKRKGDNMEPGDYLLHVRLRVDSKPSDAASPGWSVAAQGQWQLVRDGVPLAGESLSSRSRGDFAYGRPLGAGAGEAVDAIATHIAGAVGGLPELRPVASRPLPRVAVRRAQGALITASAPACQSSEDAKRCSMASR